VSTPFIYKLVLASYGPPGLAIEEATPPDRPAPGGLRTCCLLAGGGLASRGWVGRAGSLPILASRATGTTARYAGTGTATRRPSAPRGWLAPARSLCGLALSRCQFGDQEPHHRRIARTHCQGNQLPIDMPGCMDEVAAPTLASARALAPPAGAGETQKPQPHHTASLHLHWRIHLAIGSDAASSLPRS
jgi:hypothetical protein